MSLTKEQLAEYSLDELDQLQHWIQQARVDRKATYRLTVDVVHRQSRDDDLASPAELAKDLYDYIRDSYGFHDNESVTIEW